jgi:hypothetical protein
MCQYSFVSWGLMVLREWDAPDREELHLICPQYSKHSSIEEKLSEFSRFITPGE